MSTQHDTAPLQLQTGHLPALDGLRGIAIGLILLHHCFGKLFGFCWIGVDLFFVLSGFLITRILLDTKNDAHYLRNFFARRVLRIFPAYYLTLLIVLVLLPLLNVSLRESWPVLLDKQVWYWTYTSNWLTVKEGWLPGESMILSHFWSLAIEEQYYLLWPFIVLLIRERWLPLVIVLLVALSVTLRVSNVFANPGYYVATITRWDGLLIGSLLAWMVKHRFALLKKTAVPVGIIAALAVAVGIAFNPTPEYSNPFMKNAGYTLLAVMFFGLIAAAFLRSGNWLGKALTMRPLLWLGKYSYGIYIFHYIIYWCLKDHFIAFFAGGGQAGGAIKLSASIACVVLTLVLAFLSFHLVEKRFLVLKKRFSYGN